VINVEQEGLLTKIGTTHFSTLEVSKIDEHLCFVATVFYGSDNTPEVQALREFRDNVLMRSSVGRMVVNSYYGGLGKKAADFIQREARFVIPFIRTGLDYLIKVYSTPSQVDK